MMLGIMGNTQHKNLDSQKVAFAMLAVGLLAPAGLILSADVSILYEFGVTALHWYIAYRHEYGMYIFLSPFYNPSSFYRPEHILFFITISLVSFVPRFAFVFQITRRYNGLSTNKRTLILGFFSESMFFAIFILNLFSMLFHPFTRFSLMIPIPTVLLSGFGLLKYRPAPEPTIPWRELEEPKQW
jgi:hypothetical protein